MKTRTFIALVLITAISSMYYMSVDMTNFNRADASMILMTLLAVFYLYTASKWYHIGYITFQKLKEQEKMATSIITRLMKKTPKEGQGSGLEKLVTEDTTGLLDRVRGINKSTKS